MTVLGFYCKHVELRLLSACLYYILLYLFIFIGSSLNVIVQSKKMGLYWFILTVSTHSIRPGWATALQNQGDDFIYSKQLRSQKEEH